MKRAQVPQGGLVIKTIVVDIIDEKSITFEQVTRSDQVTGKCRKTHINATKKGIEVAVT